MCAIVSPFEISRSIKSVKSNTKKTYLLLVKLAERNKTLKSMPRVLGHVSVGFSTFFVLNPYERKYKTKSIFFL